MMRSGFDTRWFSPKELKGETMQKRKLEWPTCVRQRFNFAFSPRKSLGLDIPSRIHG